VLSRNMFKFILAFSYKQLVHIFVNTGCRMVIAKFLRTSKEAYLLIIAYIH